jgi:hypothetical protein
MSTGIVSARIGAREVAVLLEGRRAASTLQQDAKRTGHILGGKVPVIWLDPNESTWVVDRAAVELVLAGGKP